MGSTCLIWGSLVRSRTAAAVVLMSDATAWRLGERTASSGAASHGVRSAGRGGCRDASAGWARRPRRRPPGAKVNSGRNRNPHLNLTRTYILASGRGAAFVARRRTSCSGRPPAGGGHRRAANRFCQSSSDRKKRRGAARRLPQRQAPTVAARRREAARRRTRQHHVRRGRRAAAGHGP